MRRLRIGVLAIVLLQLALISLLVAATITPTIAWDGTQVSAYAETGSPRESDKPDGTPHWATPPAAARATVVHSSKKASAHIKVWKDPATGKIKQQGNAHAEDGYYASTSADPNGGKVTVEYRRMVVIGAGSASVLLRDRLDTTPRTLHSDAIGSNQEKGPFKQDFDVEGRAMLTYLAQSTGGKVFITLPPSAVGGVTFAPDTLALLAPYILLAATVVAVTVGAVYARKRGLGKAVAPKL